MDLPVFFLYVVDRERQKDNGNLRHMMCVVES